RKLETDLQRELGRAARYQRQVSIVVLEATNLGLLREQFGAFLTDRLLQRLGESLAQGARDVDTLGAYKASGYTMILAEAHTEGAGVAARRMLAKAQPRDEHRRNLRIVVPRQRALRRLVTDERWLFESVEHKARREAFAEQHGQRPVEIEVRFRLSDNPESSMGFLRQIFCDAQTVDRHHLPIAVLPLDEHPRAFRLKTRVRYREHEAPIGPKDAAHGAHHRRE